MSPKAKKYARINYVLEITFGASVLIMALLSAASLIVERNTVLGPVFLTAMGFAVLAFASCLAGISVSNKANQARVGRLPSLCDNLFSKFGAHRS